MLYNLAKKDLCQSLGGKDHPGLSGQTMQSHVPLKQGGTRRLDMSVHVHTHTNKYPGENDVRIEQREVRRHWPWRDSDWRRQVTHSPPEPAEAVRPWPWRQPNDTCFGLLASRTEYILVVLSYLVYGNVLQQSKVTNTDEKLTCYVCHIDYIYIYVERQRLRGTERDQVIDYYFPNHVFITS